MKATTLVNSICLCPYAQEETVKAQTMNATAAFRKCSGISLFLP